MAEDGWQYDVFSYSATVRASFTAIEQAGLNGHLRMDDAKVRNLISGDRGGARRLEPGLRLTAWQRRRVRADGGREGTEDGVAR